MLYQPPDARARERYHAGESDDAYRWMGAHKTTLAGEEWQFTLWAPHAQSVSVTGEFCDWRLDAYPMRKQFDGTWEARLPAALFDAGVRGRRDAGASEKLLSYKYAVRCCDGQWRLRADPFAFASENRPNTASRLCDPALYRWQDGEWMRARAQRSLRSEAVNIYEMHLGSWRQHEDGSFYTYEETADELIPYLLDMGYTHVEFLPVMEHPLDESWGYQVTGYFAPTARYGSPFGLMRLIDRLHQANIGVLLDWVPAHFPRDEIGLRLFDGAPCYEHADSRRSDMKQWGTVLFDFSRGEACSFLLSSACYWLEFFHADGLRCDAVSAILYHDFCRDPGQWLPNNQGGRENLEGAAFLRRLNDVVARRFPGAVTIAEESTAYPGVTRAAAEGGLGFTFKWNMGWMNDMLSYIALDFPQRAAQHGKLTFSLMYAFSEHFLLPFSHDEVVHGKRSLLDKNPGDLWQKFAGLRALLGYQLAHPGKKLNFMGYEFAHFIEWKYDAPLDWFLLVYQRHPEMQRCVRDMNRLYRSLPALWRRDDSWEGFRWLNADDSAHSVLSFLRMDGEDAVLCVTNFTPAYLPAYRVGLPAYGFVRELLNTDDARYGGSGKGQTRAVRARRVPCNAFPWSCELCVPPLATVFFAYARPRRAK